MQQAWHQLTPLQIRDWVRAQIPLLGIEKVADELAKLSDKFSEIGLADPTMSVLVTQEMTRHLQPPKGWDREHVEMWKRLPYPVAAYVSNLRAKDHFAVRRLQNLSAVIKRLKEENHARSQTAA